MSFPMAVIAFNLEHVPPFLLGNNIDTCGRRVGVTTLSSSSAVPGTPLEVLIFLWVGERSLLSRKRLFSTRHISRGGVGGLIFSTRVFSLFLSGFVPSGIPRVHVTGNGEGLEHCFYLRIVDFLHGLFLGV